MAALGTHWAGVRGKGRPNSGQGPTHAIRSPSAFAPEVHWIRHEEVLLNSDLAESYGVQTGALNRAVKRNADRFPGDFMFQLTREDVDSLRCQTGILKTQRGRHLKYLPYAFTEQGGALLSSVLRSPRAAQVNIAIMRTFVQLRRLMDSNRALARKIDSLEKKYDAQFRAVFDAIKRLIAADTAEKTKPKREIGFHAAKL